MSFSYQIHPKAQAVFIIGGKQWTGTDLHESARRIIRDSQFKPSYDWVYNLLRTQHVHILPQDMHDLVQQLEASRRQKKEKWEKSRTVIVTKHPDVFSTGTLYKHMTERESNRFAIVETLDEAYAWLGLIPENRPH